MTRPADIPEDVWQLAETALLQANTKAHMLAEPTDPLECIARAVLADRAGRISTTGLTARQADCLRAIQAHQTAHGVSPTVRNLMDALGLGSTSGVIRLLEGLEDRGVIQRRPNRARAITIIATPAN